MWMWVGMLGNGAGGVDIWPILAWYMRSISLSILFFFVYTYFSFFASVLWLCPAEPSIFSLCFLTESAPDFVVLSAVVMSYPS